ncbi:MAG: hypothetical protein IAI50_11125 [Candidatus Eremiobacteraeota bacterium]|nr:hypothetical protein [Candidatus Eremiobacteraeota bacterium]
MNESVADARRDLFILKARLLEAEMARDESDRLKERLRDTAAQVFAELRIARERMTVLEAQIRRVERENAALSERLPSDLARATELRDALVRAQTELVTAHETSNENELLVDSLQLQLVELRSELARVRRLEPSAVERA